MKPKLLHSWNSKQSIFRLLLRMKLVQNINNEVNGAFKCGIIYKHDNSSCHRKMMTFAILQINNY